MKRILLKDLLFESVTYKSAKDVQFLLYDFYVLSYIMTLNINPQQKGFVGRFNQPETLKDDIDYASSVLLPHLKKHMLDALFFCICAELKYFPQLTVKDNSEKVFDKHEVLYTYYKLRSPEWKDPPVLVEPRKSPGPDRNELHLRSWRAAIQAIKNTGLSKDFFIRGAYDAFSKKNKWDRQYGGEPWQNICKAWERLSAAKNYNEISVAVDHVYDLQHNTGFALNKIPEYNGSWIKSSLDHKAQAKNIRELIPFCSSDMKKLAYQAVRAAG